MGPGVVREGCLKMSVLKKPKANTDINDYCIK